MLNDDFEKQQQRNLFLAMILMLGLGLVWIQFLAPPPPQGPAPLTERALEEQVPSPRPSPRLPQDAPQAGEFALLPPIAESGDPARDEILISDEYLELTFTAVGARLKRGWVLLGEDGEDSIQLVPEPGDETPDAAAVYPLGLRFAPERFAPENFGDELDKRRWTIAPGASGKAVSFQLDLPGRARLTKSFSLTDSPRVVAISVTYRNDEEGLRVLGTDTGAPAFSLNWGPNVASGDFDGYSKQEIIWGRPEGNESLTTDDLELPAGGAEYSAEAAGPAWAGIKSKYFVVALKPEFENAKGWAAGTEEAFRLGVGAPRVELEAGDSVAQAYQLYMGPMEISALKQAWPGLDSVMHFFTMFDFMDKFAKGLLGIMNWFHAHVWANYGLAIIFVTIVVRSAMYPLTLKSTRSMKKMQMLAPEMEALKKEYSDKPQEMQKKIMELYKERGVNPLGGCLPMLLQLPVFIAFFRILQNAFELRGQSFLWIDDLTKMDALYSFPIEIPILFFTLSAFNLLPILCSIAMYVSQKLMPASGPAQNPQQKMIMNIMPVMMGVIFYNMSSGVNLYILTSTLVGIIQNHFVHVKKMDVEPTKKKNKKTVKKPKHFYAAAQAKKREMAKEAKRIKRTKHSRGTSAAGQKDKKRS